MLLEGGSRGNHSCTGTASGLMNLRRWQLCMVIDAQIAMRGYLIQSGSAFHFSVIVHEADKYTDRER